MPLAIPWIVGGLLGLGALAQVVLGVKHGRENPLGQLNKGPQKKEDDKKKAKGGPAKQAGPAAAGAAVGYASKGLFGIGKSGFWIISILVALFLGVVFWFVRRKKSPAESDDVEFYAGALGIPVEEARKMSRAYLAGCLSAKRREDKLTINGEKVLGLKPTSVTATFGKNSFGGYEWSRRSY